VSEPRAVATGSSDLTLILDPIATAPGSDTRPSLVRATDTKVDHEDEFK